MAKVGRPSTYKKSYCEEVIEMGKQGKTLAQFAAHFNVAKQTVQQWCEDHPEFSVAYTTARAHCENWWTDLWMRKASGDQVQGSDQLIKFMMSAGFGYREKSDTTSTTTVNLTTSAADIIKQASNVTATDSADQG